MIGKLKRSLKERCPDCGKVLQLRVMDIRAIINGDEVLVPKEYISCSNPNCDYERDVEQKRRRRQEEEIIS